MKPVLIATLAAAISDLAGARTQIGLVDKLFSGEPFNLNLSDKRFDETRRELERQASEALEHAENDLNEAVSLSLVLRGQLSRLRKAIEDKQSPIVLDTLITEFTVNALTELTSPMFLMVPLDKRELYEQKIGPPFGEDVLKTFPDTARDVNAAARCLAVDESVACVFHSMRILEHGLRGFADHIGVTFPAPLDLENWKNIIDKIEAEIRKLEQQPKSTGKTAKTEAYSKAATQFRYFKDAWRNHVSHSHEHYDEREAAIVYDHVRDFMQQMVKVMQL